VAAGEIVPVLPSWLTDLLRDQFAALLPERPSVNPTHPLGCDRRRISDRIVFDKLLQLLRFGCSYQAIADTTYSATTIRHRCDEWIRLGIFARLKQIALQSHDRIEPPRLPAARPDAEPTGRPRTAAGRHHQELVGRPARSVATRQWSTISSPSNSP
jgi:transposase